MHQEFQALLIGNQAINQDALSLEVAAKACNTIAPLSSKTLLELPYRLKRLKSKNLGCLFIIFIKIFAI